MSKLAQIKALREARAARSNPFEDAARGRDPAPKKSQATESQREVQPQKGRSETPSAGLPLTASKRKATKSKLAPSAVSTAGASPATKSDGRTKAKRAKTGNMPGSVPGEEVSSGATRIARPAVSEAALTPHAGVVPRPSDATKRPVGRPKVEGPRPWEKLGISRRTWYRSRETEK